MLTNEAKREEVARLLHVYSGGVFESFWSFAGPDRVRERVHIMRVLTGGKVTIKHAGVNNLRAACFELFETPDGSMAAREEAFYRASWDVYAAYVKRLPMPVGRAPNSRCRLGE